MLAATKAEDEAKQEAALAAEKAAEAEAAAKAKAAKDAAEATAEAEAEAMIRARAAEFKLQQEAQVAPVWPSEATATMPRSALIPTCADRPRRRSPAQCDSSKTLRGGARCALRLNQSIYVVCSPSLLIHTNGAQSRSLHLFSFTRTGGVRGPVVGAWVGRGGDGEGAGPRAAP